MSNPTTFVNNYVAAVDTLVASLEQLRLYNSMISADSTLISRYFATANARTDIVVQDVTDAKNAVVQVLFTFDSGSPAQKAALFKMQE